MAVDADLNLSFAGLLLCGLLGFIYYLCVC